MATPNIGEAATVSLRNRSKMLADNVTNNNATLYRLKQRNKIKTADGGRTIVEELSFAENSTYKRYQGYEALDISPQQVFDAAEFDWKQVAVVVSISGLERLQNSGTEKMIDLLTARIENAEDSMANGINEDIHSDGTGDGGKQIGGLQAIIDSTPATGTVGGINAANYEFWRNLNNTVSGLNTSNIVENMQATYVQLVRGTDKPDLILQDNNHYTHLLAALQDQQRFQRSKMADAGFESLMFMGVDVVLDGGFGGAMPNDRTYFANCKYLKWRPHRDRNMVPDSERRYATNQDAMIQHLYWAGNLTCSNRSLQGVMTG